MYNIFVYFQPQLQDGQCSQATDPGEGLLPVVTKQPYKQHTPEDGTVLIAVCQ